MLASPLCQHWMQCLPDSLSSSCNKSRKKQNHQLKICSSLFILSVAVEQASGIIFWCLPLGSCWLLILLYPHCCLRSENTNSSNILTFSAFHFWRANNKCFFSHLNTYFPRICHLFSKENKLTSYIINLSSFSLFFFWTLYWPFPLRTCFKHTQSFGPVRSHQYQLE